MASRGVPAISVDTSAAISNYSSEESSNRYPTTPISPGTLHPDPSTSAYLSVGSNGVPQSPTNSTYSSIGGSTLHPSRNHSTSSASHNNDLHLKVDAYRPSSPPSSSTEENPLAADPGKEDLFVPPEKMPFAFTRGELGKFLNPKSLAAFYAIGGADGLEKGLHTNLAKGLDEQEAKIDGTVSFEEATAHVTKGTRGHRWRADSSVSYASTLPAPVPAAVSKDHPAASAKRPQSSASTVLRDEEHGGVIPPPPNQFEDRIRVYGDNRLPKKKGKSIWQLMWEAYKDPFILVLTGAAVISLALGLYETFGVTHAPGEPMPVDWVEGVAIVVAIVIVVVVSAGNDWQKERQFGKLNRKKEDRMVQVVRSGKIKDISVYDLLVGDVVCLNQGDLIPADGIVIESNEVKCDESSATGESDQMKKTAGKDVFERIAANGGKTTGLEKLDPFVISGGKVLEGTGRYVVTAVGVNSEFGKIMMSLRHEAEKTPLQVKLEGFAGAITKFGIGSAVALLLVLTFKFIGGLSNNPGTPAEKASTFLDILIVAVTIIVVAVPEGLPLAVTLALAYATTRMLKDNNLVRVLRACETMGNATTVCSDKTGTLTQNKMTVVTGTIGLKSRFAQVEVDGQEAETIKAAFDRYSNQTKEILRASVVLNSTATDGEASGTFAGSKTETALLSLVGDHIGIGGPLSAVRGRYTIQQIFPFDSSRKCMGIVVATPGGFRLYIKGASEILLDKCVRVIADVTEETLKGVPSTKELALDDIKFFEDTITTYARRSLRTIALVYKDYTQWPPVGASVLPESTATGKIKVAFEDLFNDLTLFGIVGIQDPLRPGVPEAVQKCHMAGVTVRMVTGDNIETAKAIAKECGIYDDSPESKHLFMEGPTFRKLSAEKMAHVIKDLRVLARSSPEDKRILVKALKEQDEIVAVTGDGTNDGPALKMADVGFSMGIAGTEVAKEASAIILMDDNFSSIVKAIMWGRAVNDAVQKFLQFQLTVNITAVILTFVSAVASSDMKSVLTAVQLLWVNLIMDTFAALALATDAPTPAILDRKPASKRTGLVTLRMWKMIIGQAIFQLIITFMLHFGGEKMFGYSTDKEIAELRTMVFNTFVWMQIFNEFNNRRLDNKFNIFENIHRNHFFIGINIVMFAGQVAIIFVGGRAFQIVRISGTQWGICLALAVVCMPWAVVIRCMPDEWAQRIWEVALRPVVKVLAAIVHLIAKPFAKLFKRKGKKEEEREGEVGHLEVGEMERVRSRQ